MKRTHSENEKDKQKLKITRKIGEKVVETIFLEFLGNSDDQFQNLSDIPFFKEHMNQSPNKTVKEIQRSNSSLQYKQSRDHQPINSNINEDVKINSHKQIKVKSDIPPQQNLKSYENLANQIKKNEKPFNEKEARSSFGESNMLNFFNPSMCKITFGGNSSINNSPDKLAVSQRNEKINQDLGSKINTTLNKNKPKRKIKSGLFKIGHSKNKAALKTLKNILLNKNTGSSENNLWRKEVIRESRQEHSVHLLDPTHAITRNQIPQLQSFVVNDPAYRYQHSFQYSRSQRYSSPEIFINNAIDEMTQDLETLKLKPKHFESIIDSDLIYEDFYKDSALDFIMSSTDCVKSITSNRKSGSTNFLYNEDLNERISFERIHHHSGSTVTCKKSSKDVGNKLKLKSKTFISLEIKQNKEGLIPNTQQEPQNTMKRIVIGHEVYKIGDLVNAEIKRRGSLFHYTSSHFEDNDNMKLKEKPKNKNSMRHMSILRK